MSSSKRKKPPRDEYKDSKAYKSKSLHTSDYKDYHSSSKKIRIEISSDDNSVESNKRSKNKKSFNALCLSNISSNVDDQTLKDFVMSEFLKYGKYDMAVGEFSGDRAVYINFCNPADAASAYSKIRNLYIGSKPLKIRPIYCNDYPIRNSSHGRRSKSPVEHKVRQSTTTLKNKDKMIKPTEREYRRELEELYLRQKQDIESQVSNKMAGRLGFTTNQQPQIETQARPRHTNHSNGHSIMEPLKNHAEFKESHSSAAAYRGHSSGYESLRSERRISEVTIENLERELTRRATQVEQLTSALEAETTTSRCLRKEAAVQTETTEQLRRQLTSHKSRLQDQAGKRYDALLLMYGEKMNECDKLKADLLQLKSVYNFHVDLLSRQ